MADRETAGADAARLEALRRRLYQRGVSEEDRRRFAAEEPIAAASEQEPGPVPSPRRPPHVPAVLVAIVVVTAAGALLVAVPQQQPPPSSSPSTSPPPQQVETGAEVPVALVAPAGDAPTPTSVPTRLASVPTRLQRFHGAGGTSSRSTPAGRSRWTARCW